MTDGGPQANLFGGLTIVGTACFIALKHAFFPVAEIMTVLTLLLGAGTGLLGFTMTKRKESSK